MSYMPSCRAALNTKGLSQDSAVVQEAYQASPVPVPVPVEAPERSVAPVEVPVPWVPVPAPWLPVFEPVPVVPVPAVPVPAGTAKNQMDQCLIYRSLPSPSDACPKAVEQPYATCDEQGSSHQKECRVTVGSRYTVATQIRGGQQNHGHG